MLQSSPTRSDGRHWVRRAAPMSPARAPAAGLAVRLAPVSSAGTRVFVARLAGTAVFDPIGDQVGRTRDVVMLFREKASPRAVGLVVEVPGRRRVFLPLTRVTSIDAGQVISTGLVNMRRFEQRGSETLAIGELLDRTVQFVDGSGSASIEDIAIEQQRNGDWFATQLFVRRHVAGKGGLLRRRGETLVVPTSDVTGLAQGGHAQGAALLLASYEDLKPADLADVLHDMSTTRRLQVASALDNERLADILEELPEDDQVAILSGLERGRAADVLEATEPVILGPETSIATALAHVRRQDLAPALASMVFVARQPLETPTGRFLGVVHLQRMRREAPHESIGAIMDSDIDAVTADAPLLQVTRLLATYNLLALPVVDGEKRLLGAVSVDDVLDHLLPEDWRGIDDEPPSVGPAAAPVATTPGTSPTGGTRG